MASHTAFPSATNVGSQDQCSAIRVTLNRLSLATAYRSKLQHVQRLLPVVCRRDTFICHSKQRTFTVLPYCRLF